MYELLNNVKPINQLGGIAVFKGDGDQLNFTDVGRIVRMMKDHNKHHCGFFEMDMMYKMEYVDNNDTKFLITYFDTESG